MANPRVIFRADASLQMGTGHVIRCLTLADALAAKGADCQFICRAHPGHLADLIRQKGYPVHLLDVVRDLPEQDAPLAHASWLGASMAQDAAQTAALLAHLQPDWLVVDHYALDVRWEALQRQQVGKLLVIDDCADRDHDCDVLLDQNMVADSSTRYLNKVPKHCRCLLGPQYALIRPEFCSLRSVSLARRQVSELRRVLVFMGGSDPENDTTKVVNGLKISNVNGLQVDVVVGKSFTELDVLNVSLKSLPNSKLHIQTPDMALLMAAADLAVTGGGSVTWEKCTLGLPSLVAVQGDNQYPIAQMMHMQEAQRTLGHAQDLTPELYAHYINSTHLEDLARMSEAASSICSGDGLFAIIEAMDSCV